MERKLTKEELELALDSHILWLDTNGDEGERADLSGVDLRKAKLSEVDLIDANLTRTDFTGANLKGTIFYKGQTYRSVY